MKAERHSTHYITTTIPIHDTATSFELHPAVAGEVTSATCATNPQSQETMWRKGQGCRNSRGQFGQVIPG